MAATQVKTTDAPLAFDMGDASFRRDPYRRYAELRESDVLHRTRDDFWVLTRHADVLAAVRDHRLSATRSTSPGRPGTPARRGSRSWGTWGSSCS